MWYFSWVLGVGLAMAFGIINVMWLEAEYFCKIDLEEAKGIIGDRPRSF
jgi:cyd operon protein YbgT